VLLFSEPLSYKSLSRGLIKDAHRTAYHEALFQRFDTRISEGMQCLSTTEERIMASSNQGGNKQSGDTSNRGFASMDPQKQREIASEGGRAAHASGNAHEFTSEEARKAGSMSHKNDDKR